MQEENIHSFLNIGLIYKKIIFPFTLILCFRLAFEIIEFFRLGGANQPLAWCIVKISVLNSTIIGLSSERIDGYSVNYEFLIDKIKSASIDK